MKQYFVGGYVRDKLLGLDSKDIDIAVEGTYDEMYEYLFDNHVVMFQERPEFNIIRAYDHALGPVDYTACPNGIEADLNRRDFTINAMAIPRDDESKIIDLHEGRHDLLWKTIRCVPEAYDRIVEDPIRIIRALRFSLKYNFYISESTLNTMYNLRHRLKEVSPERLRQELEKCFRIDTLKTLMFFQRNELDTVVFNEENNLGIWLKPTTEEK